MVGIKHSETVTDNVDTVTAEKWNADHIITGNIVPQNPGYSIGSSTNPFVGIYFGTSDSPKFRTYRYSSLIFEILKNITSGIVRLEVREAGPDELVFRSHIGTDIFKITETGDIILTGNVDGVDIANHVHSGGSLGLTIDHGTTTGKSDDDHPEYLRLNKSGQTLQQNLSVAAGITIDGKDISSIGEGWHASSTRIKISPQDFRRGGAADYYCSGSTGSLQGSGSLWATSYIPTGFKATAVRIYGSAGVDIDIYECRIDDNTLDSRGSGTTFAEIDITDVTSSSVNYLAIRATKTAAFSVYGGYVTIVKV